ncbi:MAG: DUF6261 family protein [Mangrovibacterium sp.]
MKNITWRTKNAELAATIEVILRLIQQSDLLQLDENIGKLFARLSNLHRDLLEALVPTMKKSQLTQKDLTRKKHYAALFAILKGLNAVPELREDVTPLWELMCRFGNSTVTRSNQREASALIDSFLRKLQEENYAQLLNHLECAKLIAPEVEQLKQAQRDFAAEQLKQIKRVVTRRKKPTATDIREEILRLINNDFADYLSISALFDENRYGDLLRAMNQTISMNNTAVHRGLRMKANAKIAAKASEEKKETAEQTAENNPRLSLKTKVAAHYYTGEILLLNHRRTSPLKSRHGWKVSYQERLRQRRL